MVSAITPSRYRSVPREVARSGSTRDLCEQFILSQSLDPPDGFETRALGAWRLSHHPTLPVVSIRNEDVAPDDPGASIGWLLGYPITRAGQLLGAGSAIDIPVDRARVDRARLDLVDSLGGRFLAVFLDGPTPAVYPDAAATYSSVFCPTLGIVASTPGLIPYDETTGDRSDLVSDLGIPLTNSMYPLGLTPRHGIHRLLPNHHLDLHTWTMTRHGPTWRERGSVSLDESVANVATIVRRNIAAVLDVYPSYLQLTAGNDSRMLLACLRERQADVVTYTLKLPDLSGMTDAKVAARLSKRAGISHETVRMLTPDPADLDMWLYRTSCSVGEPRGWKAATSYRSLDTSRAHIAGNVGDLARIGYWATIGNSKRSATLEELTAHALAHRRPTLDPGQQRAAASRVVREQIDRWRSEASAPDELALLDLLFVENRLASWAGIWPYAQFYGPGFTYFPMAHREVIDLMMGLSEEVRRGEQFNQMVIRREWPELLDLPFNTPSPAIRAAHLPTRVRQGVRRRLQR